MKPELLAVGHRVQDRWYPDWGVGTVVKLTKTRVHIRFPGHVNRQTYTDVCVYDHAHIRQFVEPEGVALLRKRKR